MNQIYFLGNFQSAHNGPPGTLFFSNPTAEQCCGERRFFLFQHRHSVFSQMLCTVDVRDRYTYTDDSGCFGGEHHGTTDTLWMPRALGNLNRAVFFGREYHNLLEQQ